MHTKMIKNINLISKQEHQSLQREASKFNYRTQDIHKKWNCYSTKPLIFFAAPPSSVWKYTIIDGEEPLRISRIKAVVHVSLCKRSKMGNIWTNTVPKSNNNNKKQSGQEICHQMLTLLWDQYTIYILKYFCMRYFMNTGNGQRINVINAN